MHVNPIFKCFHLHSVGSMAYSIPYTTHSIPRVPPGLTADAISEALRFHFNPSIIHVQLVPAKPMFRYGGVQHAALITMSAAKKELDQLDQLDHWKEEIRVVYDLEAQAHFTLQIQTMQTTAVVGKWRWALRGLVIQ